LAHPSHDDLIRFAHLPVDERVSMPLVAAHVLECGVCADEMAAIGEWLAELERSTVSGTLPLSGMAASILTRAAQLMRTIVLVPLETSPIAISPPALAADGASQPSPGWTHRATLYSEIPELVMRVMHDAATNRDFLHLSGADPELTRHVMIHLVEPSLDFLTNENGIAEVEAGAIVDPGSVSWQLRLPDATFHLSTLELGQEQVPGSGTVLETPDGNRVEARMVDQHGGILLSVRPLAIGGMTEFARVQIVVSQVGGRWRIGEAASSHESVSAQVAAGEPIEIRLFLAS